MPTLLEIAEREEENSGIVLFDGSISAISDFLNVIFDVENYADLKKESLEDKLRVTNNFLDFISKENTFTVKAAVKDFECVHKVVSEKQSHFNKHEKWMGSYKQFKKYVLSGAEKKELFRQISANLFEIFKYVKSNKVFKPVDVGKYSRSYEKIPDILTASPEAAELKTRNHELYAAALYSSMQKPVTLIVAGREFYGGLKLIMERFSLQSPITIYFMDDKNHYKIRHIA